ncbi:helix-turn-helix domain-containing protein [Arthrobacter rhombi]|uniref:helix-turn-helix domain-containing protein n=1 Tax=Arthrobacter rhombi TaxID=71253 RepID=UPI003FD40511
MFEEAFTAKWVMVALEFARATVQMLYQRWQLRGPRVLVTRERKQHDFDTNLQIVLRHTKGGFGRAMAEEIGLASPNTVANWTGKFQRDGPDGLRPKKRGRPPTTR